MPGLVKSVIPVNVLPWVDPPAAYYDPEQARLSRERREREAAQAEVERKKLCEELLAKKPTGSWDSFVRKLRIWYNDCSEPGSASQETASPAKEHEKDPKPVKGPEPKYHGGRF